MSSHAKRSPRRGAKFSPPCAKWEARGEIRGGRFVAGYVGEQYALPDAIEALRAARRNADETDVVTVAAYDPLSVTTASCPAPAAAFTRSFLALRLRSWR